MERRIPSIVEDLADQAIFRSSLNKEAMSLKNRSNSSRRRKKCSVGSCIDPKDKKRGAVKRYSALERAVFAVFRKMKEGVPEREISTYTDIILKIVSDWDKVCDQLIARGLIAEDEVCGTLSKVKGKIRLTKPWLELAIQELYFDKFSEIFFKKPRNKKKKISLKEIRSQVSSISSEVMKVFSKLKMILNVEEKIGHKGTKVFYLKEETKKLSFEQLYFLFFEGKQIIKAESAGEFAEADNWGLLEDVIDEESSIRTIVINPGDKKFKDHAVVFEAEGRLVIRVSYEE